MGAFFCTSCGAAHETPPYDGAFVLYEGKCWCAACLLKKRTGRYTHLDKWSPESADEKLASLRKDTEKQIQLEAAKEELCEYIEETYAPSYIPKSFYQKLDAIFDGTLSGLRVPVPPEDLLDMFRRQQEFLNRRALKKWGLNQPLPMPRLNYDLAVLLGSYDGYLQMKKAQEAENREADQRMQEINQAAQYVHVPRPAPKAQSPAVNIGSILDDLLD